MKGKGGEGEEAGSEQRGLRAEGLTHEPSPWGQILTLPLATEDSKPLTPPNPAELGQGLCAIQVLDPPAATPCLTWNCNFLGPTDPPSGWSSTRSKGMWMWVWGAGVWELDWNLWVGAPSKTRLFNSSVSNCPSSTKATASGLLGGVTGDFRPLGPASLHSKG